MKRLFIAIRIPAEKLQPIERAQILLRKNAKQKDIEVKWSPFTNYHVTLKFLGETEVDRVGEISRTLAEISQRHTPFSLKISGVGAFPDEHHARVIYFGVQSSRALRSFQEDVELTMQALNFAAETHEFVPHLTIGRLRKSRSVKDMISPLVRKKLAFVEVKTLVLYESHLQNFFPIYKPIAEFSLASEIKN